MPQPPHGPAATVGSRLGARAIDLMIEAALAFAIIAVADSRRTFAIWFVVAMLITAYETLMTSAFGGTLGKLAVGIRVTELDATGHPSLRSAFRRSLAVGVIAVCILAGWVAWLFSVLMSPLRRGFPDRLGRTIVVRSDAPLPIATVSLPGFADAEVAPHITPWGRVATLENRRRARARRLADAPLLVLAMVALVGAAMLPVSKISVILLTSAIWIVVFIADETWRVARLGATAGHRQAGLVIRDMRTGEAPSPGRSFARALVLALLLYVPVLWPITAISLIMIMASTNGRALHDVAGRTIVVADPNLDPEQQRQMAMSLRLGTTI